MLGAFKVGVPSRLPPAEIPLMPLRNSGFALALVSLLGSAAASAADWPQFRGPNCTGIASSEESLPVEFSAEQNVKWKAPLGDGIGSPSIAAGRCFVSSMKDETTVALTAFDAATGKQLWERT